jgi:hypothetical protein
MILYFLNLDQLGNNLEFDDNTREAFAEAAIVQETSATTD